MPENIGYSSDPGSILRIFPSGREDRATRPFQTRGRAPLNPGLSYEDNARIAGGNRTIIPGSGRVPGEMSPLTRQILGDPRGRPSARPSVSRSNPELLERVMYERDKAGFEARTGAGTPRGRSSGAGSSTAAPRRKRRFGRRSRNLGINMEGFGSTTGRATGASPEMRSRVMGNIDRSRTARAARQGAEYRMPIGPRGGQNIPMLDRPDPIGLNVRRNVEQSRVARGARQAAEMRPPIGPNGAGLPPQYARGSQNAVVQTRFGDMGMGIPANAPNGGGLPAQYARGSQNTPIRTPTPPGGGGTPQGRALDGGRKLSKRGRGLLIGAGAAVVAGLAYSGRRGEGSSGGRTSMSRY